MVKASQGHGLKNVCVYHDIRCNYCSIFANDGATLILTPIALAMIRNLGFNKS